MTESYIYPRLDDATALSLREDLIEVGPTQASEFAAVAHPGQYYAATGGSRVPAKHLGEVRKEVLKATDGLVNLDVQESLSREQLRTLDRSAGRALVSSMAIIPSDAAHDGVWSFMTLVLLPEVAFARFPDLPVPRALGRPRNVLRRVWWRQHVLGDLLDPPGRSEHGTAEPLGEDELVQLFERSSLASDRRLVSALADRALRHPGPDRSSFVRRLAKRVLAEAAHVELTILSDDELASLIERSAA